jgi:3'-5' exonuclease
MAAPTTLVVDIETVGPGRGQLSPRAMELLVRDAATESEREEIESRFALDPCTGRIVCIGVYWIEVDRSRAYCQREELELLANFWSDVARIRPTRFVTFNGKAFDFPYIILRSAILGLPTPRDIHLDTRRFSTERHFDVREALTNYDLYRRGTLEYFCEVFGVPSPKGSLDGSRVGEYFEAGRLDDIAKYCLDDCKATAELYRRIRSYFR